MRNIVAAVTPLIESHWVGSTAVDPYGRTGIVRLVYQVGLVQVAVLTDPTPAVNTCPIWDLPVDLLTPDEGTAAFPDYREQSRVMDGLRLRLLISGASAADEDDYRVLKDRYRVLVGRLTPYPGAQHRLHRFLIAQLAAGDSVIDTFQGRRGVVLDPNPRPLPHITDPMVVQFEESRSRDDQRWPDGTAFLSVQGLFPSLGLL
ncbi:hypothetical protein ACIREO_22210 [Streptomyces sp. NPDC102441]|uniref:hypothetical protein n=1 Tax=Streptomyces sp. NPDC102441 TaxID=3366176 RepID=UPI0038195916